MFTLIDLTPYSILSVTVVTSVFIIIFVIITRIKAVISRLPMWLPVTLAVIMGIRLLFPVEFLFASDTLLSFDVFPHIDNVIYADIPVINNVTPSIKITVVNVFCLVWGIGAIIFIFKYINEYRKFYRAIRHIDSTNDPLILDVLNNIKVEYNFKFEVKIIVNKVIPSPAEFGFFRQVIFLNDYKYTAEELNCILSHELTHFYNKSNWIKLFMDMVKSILWWNPVVHLLQRHIDDLLEIYVDAFVTKDKSHEYKIGYLKCIEKVLKISKSKGKVIPQMNFVHSMAATSKSKLKEDIIMKRCNVIRYGIKNNIPICILIVLILIVYIFISSRYVVQPAYIPPYNEERIITDFTEDNSYIVKEGDTYILYYNDIPYSSNPYIDELPNVPIINK